MVKMKTGKLPCSLLIIFCSCLCSQILFAQTPRLIVGITIDQMNDALIRKFSSNFTEDGFKLLENHGYRYTQNHYNYIPTYTGPGYASIHTGSTPSVHGIIGNDWIDRATGKEVYCAGDPDESPVGGSGDGGISPRQLLCATLSDMIETSSGGLSKTISIAVKDRAAVLSAGMNADGAYWFDENSGNWITSSFYSAELPEWVAEFNTRQITKSMMNLSWNTTMASDRYHTTLPDDNQYEGRFPGENTSAFPHFINGPADTPYESIKYSPFSNSLTTLLALEAIRNEELGADSVTDLLAIGYSATDYIGHRFGEGSIELEDAFIRLDKEIAVLIKQLDESVGKGRYLLFLTADHGVAPNPDLMMKEKEQGGHFSNKELQTRLNDKIEEKYGVANCVSGIINFQVYLDEERITASRKKVASIEAFVKQLVGETEGVQSAYTRKDIARSKREKTAEMISNGCMYPRSGNVMFSLLPYWVNARKHGSDHGSGHDYDTHVPLIFYGMNIRFGRSAESTTPADITPTILHLLGHEPPENCTGRILMINETE